VPKGGLTLGTDGNFYGTTDGGGAYLFGTIFKMTPTGSLTVLHDFGSGLDLDGGFPYASPVEGNDGNFYGTTLGSTYGTIYKITPSGDLTSLHHFTFTDGSNPSGPLVLGDDGNFYGTTSNGGSSGAGVVYKITPAGTLTVLHSFSTTDGEAPVGPLVQGNDGNFYGVTSAGGSSDAGVVFKITPTGALTTLHEMNGSTDGSSPSAGLIQATDGKFYGVAAGGGTRTCDCGTIFTVTSEGVFNVLYNFDRTSGSSPYVPLRQHTNGIFYGDTWIGGLDKAKCSQGGDHCGVFYSWNEGLKPFVSLLPFSGRVGATVELLGNGFTTASGVFFNGTSAAFNVFSDTYLTAIVPKGTTSGFVTVTFAQGELKSNRKFLVIK